jgi:hypothetical protein
MSTIIMTACWPLGDMSPAQKSVLVSLADQANDDGYCWPSIKTITVRTCLSERAVQGAIRWLIAARILRASERSGTSTVYQITPAAYAPPQEMRPAGNAPAPAGAAPPPPQELHPTPAGAAPKPSMNHQLNRHEPKEKRVTAPAFVLPNWINAQHWDAWHSCPKRRKATNAQKQMAVEKLAKWRDEGVDFAAALENAAIGGWQGLFKPDVPAAAVTPGRRSGIPINKQEALEQRNREVAAGWMPPELRGPGQGAH